MSEIQYPSEPTYWLAYSNGVRHSGVTEPDQVTTTGQPNFINDIDPRQFATDVDVAGVADFNPLPAVGEPVEKDVIYTFEGKTLVCYQSHNRMSFDPFTTPALFGKAKSPNEPWVQPLGAHDTYRIGDEVLHANRHYRSLIANNVWEPGAVGSESLWEDMTVTEPPNDTPAAWKPWTSGLNADLYQIGDRVTHKGAVWRATTGNNHWEPSVFGWVQE
jgi:hypothetical protein